MVTVLPLNFTSPLPDSACGSSPGASALKSTGNVMLSTGPVGIVAFASSLKAWSPVRASAVTSSLRPGEASAYAVLVAFNDVTRYIVAERELGTINEELERRVQARTAELQASNASTSPQDRQAMIETMVAGLDDKLKQNPRDEEGWMRLIRSYAVLGKTDQAREALGRAVAAFGADSEQAKKFTAFAASLGVTATE